MANKKKEPEAQKPKGPKIVKLVTLITIVYVLMVVTLIMTALSGSVHMIQEEDYFQYSDAWLNLFELVYYFVPLFIAVCFGLIFRPFWKSFRNIMVAIFAIHCAYSFAVYGWRLSTLAEWKQEIRQSKAGYLQAGDFSHQFFDNTKDGFVDQIDFSGNLDTSLLSNGHYILTVKLSQNGKDLENGQIDSYEFVRSHEGSTIIPYAVTVDPMKFNVYFDRGPIELDLYLSKSLIVPDEMIDVLFWCRWAAFFRSTTWEGYDTKIYDEVIDINYLLGVDSFSLVTTASQATNQITFGRFTGDYGRDVDKDGLYDSLIVSFEVYSLHVGPVFVYAEVEGLEDRPFLYETILQKGNNRIYFKMDSRQLSELGTGGPFEIRKLFISNGDPTCGDKCPKRIKPIFKAWIPGYTTKPYKLEEFE